MCSLVRSDRLHDDHPVTAVKIALVVADDDQSLAARLERRQEFLVVALPEHRVLVGAELVEHVDRPVLDQGHHQGQPLALTSRQLDVGEAPVQVGGLVGQADIGQQSANMLRIDTLQAVESVEQVEVGVDGGEQVAVARRVVGIDQRAVP